MMIQLRCLVLALMPVLAGCQTAPDEPEDPANVQDVASERLALPKLAPPLTRRDMLKAVAEAASDYASARRDAENARVLDGQLFAFRIRYCGSARTDSAFRVAYDDVRGVLRAAARPDLDLTASGVRAMVPPRIEAAEGFWIARPWLLDASCPAKDQLAEAPAAAETGELQSAPAVRMPTVGVAEFFDSQSTRTLRRQGRAYEATRKMDLSQRALPVDLVLEGRIKAVDGKSILCAGGDGDSPPTCVVSVEVDRIRLELEDGVLLGEWGDT